jgi:hypothetical protein
VWALRPRGASAKAPHLRASWRSSRTVGEAGSVKLQLNINLVPIVCIISGAMFV